MILKNALNVFQDSIRMQRDDVMKIYILDPISK